MILRGKRVSILHWVASFANGSWVVLYPRYLYFTIRKLYYMAPIKLFRSPSSDE